MNLDELKKPYNPAEHEDLIYKKWEESGFFNPDVCIKEGVTDKNADYFSIVLPPPNVTGTLHMGHAFEDGIQDMVVRFERMRGKKTLWIPGTDHAAIATQAKFEKDHQKATGKSRHDYSREEFFEMVQKFALENQSGILSQLHKLGVSLDWSKLAFTLDEKRALAVKTAFKRMYDAGLIYKGGRIVNWDPKMQTTVSDDEIEWIEETVPLYYMQYGPFVIATARPETKFGDKYVVMHPDDKRYSKYKHGDILGPFEWINGPVTATVIKDPVIDMEFGSGVMTITPDHDVTDFELSIKHKLSHEPVIDLEGKLLPIAGEFAGMHIKKARPLIVEKLKTKNLLVKTEEVYTHRIATNSRGGGVIEPQIMKQWFIGVEKEFEKNGEKTTLKKLMRHAVESGQIKIRPEHFEKIYYHWIENLRDWCISRQIIYGHRIPVWYKGDEIYCGIEEPKGDGWVQDEDTLDTWFSSGLWTFSTLGWPEETDDLKNYHPTSMMMPGYEILFFWVARMILMSGFLLGEIPFREVFLHGIVRDSKGRKFSKSLNNGADPLDITSKYGTDALRMALVFGAAPGNDISFDEQKVKGMKYFANKIWNASRFVLENAGDVSRLNLDSLVEKDKETVKKFEEFAKDMTQDMENFRFYMAAEKIYHYFWHTFADIIIEDCKKRIKEGEDADSAKSLLYYLLKEQLKLLHPFMPFVTEKIWSLLPSSKNLLMVEPWPKYE